MKEVLIDLNGKQEKVVIKRLTFGEKADYENATTKLQVVNGQPKVDINRSEMKILALMYGIESAPFKKDRETIRNLPIEVGELLYKEIEDYNTFDVQKKVDSSGTFNTEQKTQKTQE